MIGVGLKSRRTGAHRAGRYGAVGWQVLDLWVGRWSDRGAGQGGVGIGKRDRVHRIGVRNTRRVVSGLVDRWPLVGSLGVGTADGGRGDHRNALGLVLIRRAGLERGDCCAVVRIELGHGAVVGHGRALPLGIIGCCGHGRSDGLGETVGKSGSACRGEHPVVAVVAWGRAVGWCDRDYGDRRSAGGIAARLGGRIGASIGIGSRIGISDWIGATDRVRSLWFAAPAALGVGTFREGPRARGKCDGRAEGESGGVFVDHEGSPEGESK